MNASSPKPFQIHISDDILSDLQVSLERTRWPDEVPGAGWTYGTDLGYQWIKGTKPRTFSSGLTDSPAGLAAWIVEKSYTWTDCQGDLDSYLGRDAILLN